MHADFTDNTISELFAVCSHLAPYTFITTPHTSRLAPYTSHLTSHTSHLTPHTSRIGAGAILIDQGLVVASTWVQSLLLLHVLLGRAEAGGDFRQLAATSLHVNRQVEVKTNPKHRLYLNLFVFRRLGLEIALRSCDDELLAKGMGRAGAARRVLQRNKR